MFLQKYLNIITDGFGEDYKQQQISLNSRFSLASSITLFLIMALVSYPHLYHAFMGDDFSRFYVVNYPLIFVCYLVAYSLFVILYMLPKRPVGAATNFLLMATVLSMTFILGVLDVINGSGTLALGLGVIFVACFYSMSFFTIAVFYPLYFIVFYMVSSLSAPFNYRTEFIPLVGLTLLLAFTMEVNRRRNFMNQRVIEEHAENLVESNQQLEILVGSKDRFISLMSHELKTPLNAVIGFSDILYKDTAGKLDNETIREFAKYILDSGNHLLSVVNNILLLNKKKAGKLKPRMGSVDLEQVLYHVMSVVNAHATVKSQILACHNKFDSGPVVQADKLLLTQVVINIVSNAVKYTPKGGTIYLSLDRVDEKIIFKCDDTGCGMTKDEIDHAMEPFNQVENFLSREEDGTGLGLSIVKELCEEMAINFTLSSEKNIGTQARLIFSA